MTNGLPDTFLAKLSEFIAAKMALHFPPERWNDLRRRIRPAAKEFGFSEEAAFVNWLVSSDLPMGKMEILASHLTVSETYFWREPQAFEALEEKILPELIRESHKGGRHLRIWSAGCATGEEPYSIATALRRALPTCADCQVSILATDINPRLLRRAQAGIYGQWSFRNAPAWLTREYFRPVAEGRLEIRPEIRDMVTFAYLNLAEDIYPSLLNSTSAMDIIFCRNVLMYFLPARVRQVVESLYRCLVEGGWLMVGACELSAQTFAQFTSVHFPGAIVYRKQATGPRPPPALGLARIRPPIVVAAPPCQAAPAVPWPAPPPRSPGLEAMPTASPPPPAPAASAETLKFPVPEGDANAVASPQGREELDSSALAIRALANQGRLSEALALCEQAVAANKLDPTLHYLRATILQEQNLASEAIASLRRTLYLEPNLMIAHYALGNLMLRQGNLLAAKRSFVNVLELLSFFPWEDILPEADGLTVGRFKEIVQATIQAGGLA